MSQIGENLRAPWQNKRSLIPAILKSYCRDNIVRIEEGQTYWCGTVSSVDAWMQRDWGGVVRGSNFGNSCPPPHEGPLFPYTQGGWAGVLNFARGRPCNPMTSGIMRLSAAYRYSPECRWLKDVGDARMDVRLKGTQAWDNFEFFFDLNQILICTS